MNSGAFHYIRLYIHVIRSPPTRAAQDESGTTSLYDIEDATSRLVFFMVAELLVKPSGQIGPYSRQYELESTAKP